MSLRTAVLLTQRFDMTAAQIILLILGCIVFAASFVLPEKKKGNNASSDSITEKEVKAELEKQLREFRVSMKESVDETISYSVEKAERSMERTLNEKVSAISEFSESVLKDIHKNHEEVVFMYDMLSDKHQNLKDTAADVEKTAKEAAASAKQIKETAKEAAASAEHIKDTVSESFTALAPQPVQEGEKIIEPAPEADKPKSKRGRPPKKKNEPTFAVSPGKNGSNNNEEILRLHNEGKSNMAIAKQLGRGVGEVKLVIDLYKGM